MKWSVVAASLAVLLLAGCAGHNHSAGTPKPSRFGSGRTIGGEETRTYDRGTADAPSGGLGFMGSGGSSDGVR